ncbi:MAG: single-stranded-DNA-specific exonuclease RecJ [Candidatus Babeliales bacterium]
MQQTARIKKGKAPTPLPQESAPSIKGCKFVWQFKEVDQSLVNAIAVTHNISLPIAHVLCARGYTTQEQIRAFLFSSLEQDVHHPGLLKDSERAVLRILKAIENQEKILIFGDYDVDGVTSCSLLMLALIPLDAQVNFHLPNRAKEGYGLSVNAVKRAVTNGYTLIITVDNGISAQAAAQCAFESGIDLIITDHHRPDQTLPPAFAIINPNQDTCPYPYKHLAGVGVSFKLISLLYAYKKLPFPDKIYELLALGTVADVVPLTGENRFWVRHGLSTINKQRSLALTVLANNSGLTTTSIDSLDIGFMIAPQINALGRLEDPRDAVKFLISSDIAEVARIGKTLKDLNEDRKRIDRAIYDDIEGAIVTQRINLDCENIIFAAHHAWPSGVIGLVAGKLMHNYGKPAFLFHLNNGMAKGSCRSIQEFDIFSALQNNKHLLTSFGGHACAAGLSLKETNLPELKENLEVQVLQKVTPDVLQPKITIDAHLMLEDATGQCMADLRQLEPFGNHNPQPVFLLKNVTLLKAPQILKDKHVRCSIFSQGVIKPIIFFNRPDLFSILQNLNDQPFDVACHLVDNEWQGVCRIELQGLDIALSTH